MTSASPTASRPRLPYARLCGISKVGSIPAVKMAAISSRSAIWDLPLLHIRVVTPIALCPSRVWPRVKLVAEHPASGRIGARAAGGVAELASEAPETRHAASATGSAIIEELAAREFGSGPQSHLDRYGENRGAGEG